ncbi:uncharacterized protein LOC129285790 isoform X2 [Prosopis cineraria]|uniref:uncharacterized protein LOC129285790 isoform X2 n=1 Tax=Prosopis cineraria TaxID=364024 RepID=UPI0024103221|nr:uncharacterized protein LOC129285790 isoform X2 [Prosopis cineraria]
MDLFLSHAIESGNDGRDRLKVSASKIVNKCGRLPIMVVAVAKTLRNHDPKEWEAAFAATEKDASLRHGNVDEEAKKFYNSLRLSFNYLDARAQDLFLLCSLFPRAYDISVELLSRIAIGLGLCGNVDSYCIARSQVLSIKTTLVSSALLLTAPQGCVKMHDVIRDVAQWIADEKIQVIMDSETKLKENVKYSSWIIKDFSNYFEGSNLEVLLVWVNANGSLEVPGAFFDGIKGLRVLLLYSKIKYGRTLALSLPKSIQSLENIQTLSLTNWKLGDISILQNLRKLQTLELTNCSIIELPSDVSQLEKLRLLGLVRCSVERNNPFEVIGRCLKLEVLYYVSNDDNLNIDAKPSEITVLQEFGIYHIEGHSSLRSFQLDGSTKRYFNSTQLKGILSEGTVKSLAARAEILELTECDETWTNLIPDVVQIKDGGMNDLIRLCLRSWPAIQCLICTNDIQPDATIFSNLVQLRLHDMHVRELCCGDYPNDFLKQLEKLDFSRCVELEGTLFKGKLELGNLKCIEIEDSSMTCLFHSSTAQSLKRLENVYISGCSKLECLISDERSAELPKVDDHQDPNQKNYHSMLPKLKFLEVRECHELTFILPICSCKELESVKIYECDELKYIFGHEEGGLYQMEKEIILPLLKELKIANAPKFVNIYPECYLPQPSQVKKSWGLCCFLPKSSVSSRDGPAFSKSTQLDCAQALKEKHVVGRSHGLFTPPFYPYKSLRKVKIEGFSELKSLFTLSVASSLKLLEKLKVIRCNAMEQIVIDEKHSYYHMNGSSISSIFPNLQQIKVIEAEKLKYVFGKCHSNQKHDVHVELNLPAFKELYLDDVPNMFSICSENYYVEALCLRGICLEKCPQLPLKTIIDLSVDVRKRQDLSRIKASKAKSIPSTTHEYFTPTSYQCNLREIEITGFSNLTSLFTLSIASSLKLLEGLVVKQCDALKHIVTDEGHGHDHINVSSIFPKLRRVYVVSCNHLEYIFSAFYSKDFKDLEFVSIVKVERLKYVFGKCHADQNQSDQIELNLPALKYLYLRDVPNMVHICTENYHVKALYVEIIHLEGCPQLPIQTFIDFLVGGHKRQDFSRRKALSLKEKGKPQSDLQELPDFRDISMGPKNYLSFRNLSMLKMEGCKQLKFTLSASTSRSIPKLRSLIVSNCEELVSIIEDEENEVRRECFPELHKIEVKQCTKLKCLLSMSTCGKLPQLMFLIIEDSPKLGQVFGWEKGTPQELVMKDVLPRLFALRLINLPALHTICQGIDFQNVKIRIVHHCPNITLTSANASSRELFDVHRTLRNDQINTDEGYYYNTFEIFDWALKRENEESKEALERDKTISEQNNSSPELANSEEAPKEVAKNDTTIDKPKSSSSNLTEIEEKGSQEVIRKDWTMPIRNNGSPNLANSDETLKEIAGKDSKTDEQNANLTKNSKASANNGIVEEQLSSSNTTTTLSSNSDMNVEATAGEDLSSENHDKRSSSTHSKREISNPCTLASTKSQIATSSAHPRLGSSQADPLDDSSIIDSAQNKKTVEASVQESPESEEAVSTNKVNDSEPRTMPAPVAHPSQIESPHVSSTCPHKNAKTTTSTIHTENLSDIFDDKSTQDQIMVNQIENSIDVKIRDDYANHKQIEEDDLVRLFRVMKESADMEIKMPCNSEIAAFEDDEVAKTFADLESSLKMDLNQIASSDDHSHRLENALNFLSTYCSYNGPLFHGLKGKIDSLHHEIRSTVFSFKQASATLETFNKLEEKEKLIDEKHAQQMEEAIGLVSKLHNTKKCMAELKEQISMLQADLKRKEEEFKDCEIKLSSLQHQKERRFSDTMGFMEEYEAVKRDKFYMVDGQAKARQDLERVKKEWPFCVVNLRKTVLLLEILLQRKL